uniref:Uncharacterized protein n=1 Tax=Leersia perrieri TaxID=77586 RepID=A0A0D9WXY6_9ORYZ
MRGGLDRRPADAAVRRCVPAAPSVPADPMPRPRQRRVAGVAGRGVHFPEVDLAIAAGGIGRPLLPPVSAVLALEPRRIG